MPAENNGNVESHLAAITAYAVKGQEPGSAVETIDKEKLASALASNTPLIGSWVWRLDVALGAKTYVIFNIYNPTNTYWHSVNLSLFFGPAHFISDVGLAIAGRDNRWTQLSGRTELQPGTIHTPIRFDFTVPVGVDPSTYFGNVVLWRYAQVFDRNFYYQTVRR